jgi:hypothetical protein
MIARYCGSRREVFLESMARNFRDVWLSGNSSGFMAEAAVNPVEGSTLWPRAAVKLQNEIWRNPNTLPPGEFSCAARSIDHVLIRGEHMNAGHNCKIAIVS